MSTKTAAYERSSDIADSARQNVMAITTALSCPTGGRRWAYGSEDLAIAADDPQPIHRIVV
jgi:hypothetical protein